MLRARCSCTAAGYAKARWVGTCVPLLTVGGLPRSKVGGSRMSPRRVFPIGTLTFALALVRCGSSAVAPSVGPPAADGGSDAGSNSDAGADAGVGGNLDGGQADAGPGTDGGQGGQDAGPGTDGGQGGQDGGS